MQNEKRADNTMPFLTDVATLRQRARQHMDSGAVTANYGADPKVVVEVLNAALATEVVCVLRYKRHYFMAQGIASESVKNEFAEHASEEQEHADRIAERVAIESYREIIEWLHGKDSTTKRMLEEILAVEEEHAEDIQSLLAGMKD